MRKLAHHLMPFAAGLAVGIVAVGVAQERGTGSSEATRRAALKQEEVRRDAAQPPTKAMTMEDMASMSPDEMMQAYAGAIDAMVAPHAAEYEMLRTQAGTWDVTESHAMAGGEPSKGVDTARMVGDFWLVSDYKGSPAGQPMEGHLVAGFDPIKKKHVGVWVDSMAPVMMHFEGDYDAATKTVTLHTEYPNPLTGQMEKFVLREVKTDANTRDWTMSMVMGDQEVPMMKSVYRRRAE